MTLGLLPDDERTALDRFRSCVLGDEALQQALSAVYEREPFADLASSAAASHGIALSRDAILAASRPEPLGLRRWRAMPTTGTGWPAKDWLPVHVAPGPDGRLLVDWAHFAGRPLTEPFFEDSLRTALARPFNNVFAYRASLEDFVARTRFDESLSPAGFIFHMSRCGSTLVSQMLAAATDNIVVSEAPPLDAIVLLGRRWPALPLAEHSRTLAAMVAALGRRRAGNERHYAVKLDCWHTLDLPLFQRAFPSVPWVFLYRDPVEVLVSQMRARGSRMFPGGMMPCPFEIEGGETMQAEEYCARVLGKICAAAVDHFGQGGGLLVNYDELPGAVWIKILPHFGIVPSKTDRAAMERTAGWDAKTPALGFVGDQAEKQRAATPAIRDAAERYLGDIYRRLETLRRARSLA